MDFDARMEMFERALAGPLPGMAVKHEFWPRRIAAAPAPKETHERAAVLVLLYEHAGRIAFPLIRRSRADGDVHSGQISLPGGRIETGETVVEAALREAEEELSIPPQKLRVLGELSPHWIPVSSYLVHPVIARIQREPAYRPDAREVAAVIRCSIEELEDSARRGKFVRERGGREVKVPCWHLEAGNLWGATAMILAELLALFAKGEPGSPDG